MAIDPLSIGLAVGGPVLSGLFNLLGGAEENRVAGEQSREARKLQLEMADRNEKLQREFAQNGIRWRSEDAKRAGIHPVVALGGGGASFSPITIGDTSPAYRSGLRDVGNSFGEMGQNLSRAVKATATESDRLGLEILQAELEGKKLGNALLGQRLAAGSSQTSQIGPAQPEESIVQPEVTYHKTKSGGLAPAPSEAFADRAEDQLIPQLAWALRNMVLPDTPNNRGLGKDEKWMWNPGRAEWEKGRPESFKWHIRTFNKFREWMRGK